MSYGTYFRFTHNGVVFTKSITTNAAGQKYPTFTNAGVINFQFQTPTLSSTGGEKRIAPYNENISYYEAIVPLKYDEYLIFANRIGEVKDRYGNAINSDIYEIIGIQPKFGFSGKKHHTLIMLKRVVEPQW